MNQMLYPQKHAAIIMFRITKQRMKNTKMAPKGRGTPFYGGCPPPHNQKYSRAYQYQFWPTSTACKKNYIIKSLGHTKLDLLLRLTRKTNMKQATNTRPAVLILFSPFTRQTKTPLRISYPTTSTAPIHLPYVTRNTTLRGDMPQNRIEN